MSEQYYDAKYFEWQKTVGELGGKANLFKFEEYIKDNDDILDFGCGGGFLLKNINTCGKKIGIDINPVARAKAKENGIVCFDDIRKVEDSSIDVLISNHALEHVDDPIIYVREFRRVVRNKGKIVIVVPHEVSSVLNPCDINNELYTWSPQNLYNLLTKCRIDTISCERLSHAWLLSDADILEKYGWEEFHKVSKMRAEKNSIYQTRAVGLVLKNENGDDDSIIRSDEGIYKLYCEKMNSEWDKTKKIIEKYQKKAIYGAGIIGRRIEKFLTENGCTPNCFVVSDTKGNEERIDGISVVGFDDLPDKKDYLFIMGIKSEEAKENIKTNLKAVGCNAVLDFNISIIECRNGC